MASKKEKLSKAVPKSKVEVEETNGHDAGIEAEGRMGKKSWSGSLRIGVIDIPVALFAAARGERVSFNMLHDLCKGKVKQAGYYCPCCIEVEVLQAFTFTPKSFVAEHICVVHTGQPAKRGCKECAIEAQEQALVERSLEPGQRVIMHAEDAEFHGAAGRVRATENAAMLDKEQIVKGFEVSKDSYTVLTKEEIDSQKPESSSTIQIDRFVPVGQVNPIYFEKSFYLAADSAVKNKSYSVLRAGLIERKVAAIGTIAMREAENIVFILPHPGGGLIAYTAYLADEIRQVAFQEPAAVSPAERDAVCKFIDAMASDLDMSVYHDSYRENVMKLIEAKAEGKTLAPMEIAKPKPATTDNLLELLTASRIAVEEQRKKKAGKAA